MARKAVPTPTIELDDLLYSERSIVFEWQAMKFGIRYNPHAFDDEYMAKQRELASELAEAGDRGDVILEAIIAYDPESDQWSDSELAVIIDEAIDEAEADNTSKIDSVTLALLDTLIGWEVKDPEGDEVPITAELLGKTSFIMRGRMFRTIMNDMSPEAATEKNSNTKGGRSKKRRGSFGGSS